MKILHVSVEAGDGWLIAQGLEEPGVITQARTIDRLLSNVREVVELMQLGGKDLQIELIVPPSVILPARTPARVSRPKSRRPRKVKPMAASIR